MKKINIAIDGYSGCGKSTLARELAAELGYIFIDTGAMFRGMTALFLNQNIKANDTEAINSLISRSPSLTFEKESNHLLLDGRDIEFEIRNDSKIASSVSDYASIPAVRTYLKDLQTSFIAEKGVVMEGRDIGTVIMPDAELKIFITASIDERIQRRLIQLNDQGENVTADYVRENLVERDRMDASRAAAPLRKASDAICIDTTLFSRKEQLEVVKAIVRPILQPEKYLPFIQ